MGEIGNLEDEAMKRKQRLANMKRKFQVKKLNRYLLLFYKSIYLYPEFFSSEATL